MSIFSDYLAICTEYIVQNLPSATNSDIWSWLYW